jgi:hypothetical protein
MRHEVEVDQGVSYETNSHLLESVALELEV